VPNDLPLNLVQPARLESLAPFPVPGVVASSAHSESGELLLEATLNASGEVVYYKILSGPNDQAVQRQLDQVMLFSRFRPQFSFGRSAGRRPRAGKLQRSARGAADPARRAGPPISRRRIERT